MLCLVHIVLQTVGLQTALEEQSDFITKVLYFQVFLRCCSIVSHIEESCFFHDDIFIILGILLPVFYCTLPRTLNKCRSGRRTIPPRRQLQIVLARTISKRGRSQVVTSISRLCTFTRYVLSLWNARLLLFVCYKLTCVNIFFYAFLIKIMF